MAFGAHRLAFKIHCGPLTVSQKKKAQPTVDTMSFFSVTRLASFPKRFGSLAMNADGTLFASVDLHAHCVYIHSVDGAGAFTADPVIVGTRDIPGSTHARLLYPRFTSFVHRQGVETLLICDSGNHRVVEVTASGVFLRVIPVRVPYGIAYCGTSDVIAVSFLEANSVALLDYESGAVKLEVNTAGDVIADGGLDLPRGVAFTRNGQFFLVADCNNHRVSMFNAGSGAFIAHVATKVAHGISCPRDVLPYADGTIIVAEASNRLLCVTEDGVTVGEIILPNVSPASVQQPFSLSYSQSLGAVVVKTFEGNVFLLRDAWMNSSRCAWICALCE
jgi:hypothetical protein